MGFEPFEISGVYAHSGGRIICLYKPQALGLLQERLPFLFYLFPLGSMANVFGSEMFLVQMRNFRYNLVV